MLALALLLAFQNPSPDATASVDRTRVRVGEELVLTIRARTGAGPAVAIDLPRLDGLSVIATRDVTEVSLGGTSGEVRTLTRSLELRADRPGTGVIGAIRVRQGKAEVATKPISVTIDSAVGGVTGDLGTLALDLLAGAPAPARTDRVAISILVPRDTVLVGEQVDVVVAAWFPRELRQQLTRPPAISLPTVAGVWSYPAAAPAGVAVSRKVRGTWMDLYALHQILFPLEPGRIVVPPATVDYGLPSGHILSTEDHLTLASDSVVLAALPLPPAPRAGDDRGVVGRGLNLSVTVDSGEARVGEPLSILATVSGVGNVDLWPEPRLSWPDGFRAYGIEQGDVQLAPENGLVAGAKTYRYLVVPDSAGTFTVPEARYPYYDLAAGAWTAARVPPRTLAIAPGTEIRASRAIPPLAEPAPPAWTGALAGALYPWVFIAVLFLPPLFWLRVRRTSAAAADDLAVTAAGPAGDLTRLGRLEREFHHVLASHVPESFARDGDGLAQALRAAGVESAVADHVMRLRDRLRAARYGRHGTGDAAEMSAEIEQVLQVLGGVERAGSRRRAVTLALLAVFAVPAARAQAPSAEALYQAGALRAAMDSFAARAAREPAVAAHWYDLGAAAYRSAADGKAAAAWTAALRLAPRDRVILAARTLEPAPDAASESLLAVGPATPAEWALVAAALWVLAWILALRRGRRWGPAIAFAATLAAAWAGVAEWRRRAAPVAVIAAPGTPVRVAPYGAASAASSLDAGAAILVENTYAQGRWLEVRRADGIHGWVLAAEVIRL
ncbi:MAG TPA: BatD family protein [Gemmatimonadales bacterium]|nr:BatD family protein [Gemmatimonadales bacterium]